MNSKNQPEVCTCPACRGERVIVCPNCKGTGKMEEVRNNLGLIINYRPYKESEADQ